MTKTQPPSVSSNGDQPLYGYHGQYLKIDVTDGSAIALPIEQPVLRNYLGGVGLGTYLLLQAETAAIDALAAASPILFSFSALVGSPLTTSAKFAVVSKSPLTNRLNDSLASSGFAISGKRTGFDALMIIGRASQPSVLVIDEDKVRLEPADRLWGLDIDATEKRLHERFPKGFQFAVIGPAGEKQIRYATISHDGRHAGRGGSGAVLGSKNIKAIAVRGRKQCRWAMPKELIAYSKSLSKKSFGPATAKYRELGTASNLLVFNRLHALPTENFQRGSFEAAESFSIQSLSQSNHKTQKSCAACTIGCEHLYTPENSGDGGDKAVRVEYESLFALGPLCGIRDSGVVLAASQRCDQLGLDTISTGGTIAFAMECVKRKLLDETAAVDWLQFGNAEAMLRAIELIGRDEGIGNLLALGSRAMAEKIGQGSLDFAPQVKGMEIPGYEPRALQTMALGFAVGTRGADHNRSGAYEVDFSDQVDRRNIDRQSVRLAIDTENQAAIMDSVILCKFLRGVFDSFFDDAAEMLQLTTGWDFTSQELQQTAARIIDAKKMFNIRAGWQPEEDILPPRFLEEHLSDDTQATLSKKTLQDMIQHYNILRGYSSEGWLRDNSVKARV